MTPVATPMRITITPAPAAVFLRASLPQVEMTVGEALRVRRELDRAIGIALAARDGSALLRMIASWRRASTRDA